MMSPCGDKLVASFLGESIIIIIIIIEGGTGCMPPISASLSGCTLVIRETC